MDHIDEKILELFVLEAPDVINERAKIEQHLKECEGCASLFEEISEYYKEVEQLVEAQDRSSRLPVSKRWFPTPYEPDRAAISKYDHSIPVRIGRFIARYPIASSSFGLAAAFVMALMLFSPKKIVTDLNPDYARAKDEFLVVYNKSGEELWRKHIGIGYNYQKVLQENPDVSPIDDFLKCSDVDGDNNKEVIAIFGWHPELPQKNVIVCFNADGSERWKYPFSRTMTWGDENFPDNFFIDFIFVDDIDNDGMMDLIANVKHSLYYADAIIRLSAKDGKFISEYWHSGHLSIIKHADLDNDGVDEIIFGGENNAYNLAVFGVLDPRYMSGHSPAILPYIPNNVIQATEKFYVLLPRTDLQVYSSRKRNVVRNIFIENTKLTAEVIEIVENKSLPMYFHFDSTLRCASVSDNDLFVAAHKKYENEGKLTLKLNEQYYADLRKGVKYWDGEKFVTYPTMNKKYQAVVVSH